MKQHTFAASGATLTALAVMAVLTLTSPPASGDPAPCVPSDAYTEVVVVTPEVPAHAETVTYPAVTHEEQVMSDPGQPSVASTEEVPTMWWVWSPNRQQGPFEGPPAFPTDERGTWQGPKSNGGPSQQETGTYQQGQGNGSWFHREAAVPGDEGQPYVAPTYQTVVVIDTAAYTETVEYPAAPAVTETVAHEAVTCDDEPVDPTDPVDPVDPVDPTDPVDPVDPTPTNPTDPADPVDPANPDADTPTPTDVTAPDEPKEFCSGTTLIIKRYDANGNGISTDMVNEAPRCAYGQPEGPTEVLKEEGF
jgi:hypothetical protein